MKVLSIEQMTRLKELGVDTSKASLHYVYLPTARSIFNETDELESEPTLFACNQEMLDGYPTFALQDVIELLPIENIDIRRNCHERWVMSYKDEITFKSEFMIDAAYNMLIWVIENNYLKTNRDENN